MKFALDRQLQRIGGQELFIDILDTGDIAEIKSGDIRINNLVGNSVTGSDTNIYLRIFENDRIDYIPLIGGLSNSRFYVEDDKAIYKGEYKGVNYVVILTVDNNKWFFEVELNGNGQVVDLVYGQGLMLNCGGNESYNAQYIDSKVFDSEMGYTVCSRGTLTGQYVQIGTIGKNVGFSTDGFQFFGLDYKVTNIIKALKSEKLANQNYQYEFTYTAIQSNKITLTQRTQVVFYGLHSKDYNEAVKDIVPRDQIIEQYNSIKPCSIDEHKLDGARLKLDVNNVFASEALTDEELSSFYPNRILTEKDDGVLLSFFTPTYEHVIMQQKEYSVERAHGHIIFNRELDFAEEVLATTNYIYGIFNSHIVVGNTNINKFTSDNRNNLNLFKTSGQRIMVEIDGQYRLLTMPSVYELGFNYSKWIYKVNNDYIVVKTYTTDDTLEIVTTVDSTNGVNYNFIVLNELTMGEDERRNEIIINKIEKGVEFTPEEGSFAYSKYPYLKYTMLIDKEYELTDDRIFFEDDRNRCEPFIVFDIKNQSDFRITTLGQLTDKKVIPTNSCFDKAKEDYRQFYVNNINEFKLHLDNNDDIEKFNATMMWFTHNALIHYITPHGLEQYGGAAWGTRDICQGPIEYFLATQNYEVCRKILLEIFRHQYVEDGTWPQWFMFDEYTNIQHPNSHGDIIAWPLRTVALYLKTTGDYSILDEKISYTTKSDLSYTTRQETLMEHLKKEVAYIENNYIEGTYLSIYDDGDWNDSMQPANKELRHNMVSGWTPILTYEGFKYLAEQLEDIDKNFANNLRASSEKIKDDINKYILKDNVPAGFLLFQEGSYKHIIHPTDNDTGIRYRLLPINRGIISEMYTKEEANHLYELAKKYLYREDGAILFSDPVVYNGGENTYFQRAEQASNVGREIGLHYVHAHLRFVEAMSNMGKAEEVWTGLSKVNPILIQSATKNAMRRQSNTYFSSSDANTLDRYEYMEKFDKVRSGDIAVKGGWRIYSSGPGIYINLLVTNALGIRLLNGDLEISPVMPKQYNNLKFDYKYLDKKVQYIYHVSDNNSIQKILINGTKAELIMSDNIYGKKKALIKKEQLNSLLTNELNRIEIFI